MKCSSVFKISRRETGIATVSQGDLLNFRKGIIRTSSLTTARVPIPPFNLSMPKVPNRYPEDTQLGFWVSLASIYLVHPLQPNPLIC
jgi:hypothetical protein